MLSLSIEKQRKRPPSFKFCLAKRMVAFLKICLTDGYADATYVRLVLKSKVNAHHLFFKLIFSLRMDGLREARIPLQPAIEPFLKPTEYTFATLPWLHIALLQEVLRQFGIFMFFLFVSKNKLGVFDPTECLVLLFYRYKPFFVVFLAFTATFHFICVLPVLLHDPTCRLLGYASGAWRLSFSR